MKNVDQIKTGAVLPIAPPLFHRLIFAGFNLSMASSRESKLGIVSSSKTPAFSHEGERTQSFFGGAWLGFVYPQITHGRRFFWKANVPASCIA